MRFTSDNYDPNQLHNKYANLTNATINKENIKEDTFEENQNSGTVNDKESLKIEGNMYTNYQFDSYLSKYQTTIDPESEGQFPNGPYLDKILPQIKKGVIASLLATRDTVQQTTPNASHEVFGYDFMVDTCFNVWLLEVNSSPSMEYSSSITERMVKEVLYNLADITIA